LNKLDGKGIAALASHGYSVVEWLSDESGYTVIRAHGHGKEVLIGHGEEKGNVSALSRAIADALKKIGREPPKLSKKMEGTLKNRLDSL